MQSKGTTGLARFFDQTATTGSTLVVVQAGQGQSGNLMEWRNYAGTVVASISGAGAMASASDWVNTVNTTGRGLYGGTDYTQGAGIVVNGPSVATVNSTIQFYRNGFVESGRWAATGNFLIGPPTDDGTNKLQINGNLRLAGAAEPTCNATFRGTIAIVTGGAGVKDTVRVCAKDAADAYAYRTIY